MRLGFNHQAGVGLVEVLVALMLLALGVIGYTALQVRAVAATSESLDRTQALTIIRSLNEKIRVNLTAARLCDSSVSPTCAPAANVVSAYASQLVTTNDSTAPAVPSVNCLTTTTPCTSAQQAAWDVYDAKRTAWTQRMRVAMIQCPGTTGMPTRCLIAAWGNTLPSSGTDASDTDSNGTQDCIKADGTYHTSATCLLMEAYQ